MYVSRVAKWKNRVNFGRQRGDGDFGVPILYEFLITEISWLPFVAPLSVFLFFVKRGRIFGCTYRHLKGSR